MLSFVSFPTLALAGVVAASVGSDVGRHELSNLEKRDQIDCSDNNLAQFISTAYAESKTLANIALDHLKNTGTSDPVFQAYFGTGLNNYTIQWNTFSAVANENSLILNCTDAYSTCTNINIANFGGFTDGGDIYFCPNFSNQYTTASLCSQTTPDTGHIRGGTVLHEVTRALTGYGWTLNGCSDARGLSSQPYRAARCADNYSCFAMQVYANTQCPS